MESVNTADYLKDTEELLKETKPIVDDFLLQMVVNGDAILINK